MVDRADIDDRIAKCSKILDENPTSQIFAALADAHRKKGELDKAFRVCQNGLKIHPNYGSGHLVMAKINLDKGMYDWAETEITKAIEIDGATRTTELLLSEIYIYKGEFNKACRLLEKLHQDDPDNSQILKLLDIARKIPLDTGLPPAPQSPTIIQPSRSNRTPNQPAPPVEDGEEPIRESAKMPDMNYKQMLKALVVTPGIEGVLLINGDGLVIEADWNVPGETELIGALAAETARYCTTQMKEVGFGELNSMLIEAGNSMTYMSNARGKLLAIVCSESINLGSLKLKLSSLMPRLAD